MTEITKSTEAKKDEMQVEKEKLESVKRADAAVKTMHDFTSPEVLYKELINSVLKYHPSTDISMIEKAYKVASEAHEGQKRKSGEPYIIHPLCVAIILADLELDKETIVAGLLHDAVEDTWMTYEEVEKEFGSEVALLVDGVTKLGLSKTDKITASMLEDVRKLRIVGKEILDDEDTFWGEGHHVDGKDSSFGSVRGNITDLSDLAQMVNLEELALCNQKIEDISGLKELPLKKLYLSKNMITDFSVLLNLIDLDTLCIMENPAENLSVIGECTGILRLNIQGMNLTDIDFLKNLSLDYLDMSNVEVENNIFEPLAEMKKLDTLCMCDVNAAAETLSQMSTLKALFMWGDSTILENLKPLKGMTQLETLAFTTQISSLEGIEQFPSLNFLSVSFSLVKDLSPVTGAKNLQVIDISNADIENFEPLFGHSGLTEVHCTEEQKEEIMKIDSSPDFEIYT